MRDKYCTQYFGEKQIHLIVILYSLQDILDWSKSGNLLAHEFGHILGAELHDDEFYPPERADEFIMWSVVSRGRAFHLEAVIVIVNPHIKPNS